MGLFGSKKEGGIMDVIRCDEKEFLIWKWSPNGETSRKENAIRYGSSLRVKDGEVAVFVYKQKDGTMQDFIEGPFDQTIKTANFPVLTSIVGSAFGGASPFQAEIYFINLTGAQPLTFFVPEFDVADARFTDYTVPVSVKGGLTFNIKDYRNFIKMHRMSDFEYDDLADKIKKAISRYIKDAVINAPLQLGVSLLTIEGKMSAISKLVQDDLKEALAEDFGVNLKRVDISDITLNKKTGDYQRLMGVTKELQDRMIKAQNEIGIKNLADQQAINAENYAESLRVQREETQRQQRLQTEMANLAAHQINIQGDVAKTAAESLGQLGSNPGMSMDGGGGGMNPAAMMTGMMMGGAIGGSMSNMIGNMTNNMNQPQPPSPPTGAIAAYHVAVNAQQSGPYTLEQLKQMVASNQINNTTYVWKQGMGNWEPASNVPEVNALFAAVPPPPPMMPPMPPTE